MRYLLFSIAAMTTLACTPPKAGNPATGAPDFEGNWYGIRPDGVTTFHSDSSFFTNGDIIVRFFRCLSDRTESRWTDKGIWSYADNVLTITLVSEFDDENAGESYTHQYRLLTDHFDRRTFRSELSNSTFWLLRRWRDEPYDCSTRKADLDADRAAAINSGLFQSVYPDYTGIGR